MKKLLAVLLALMMCIGIFAACGEEKKPEVKDPVDNPPVDDPADPTDKPEDPTDKPSEPTDKPEDPTDKPADPATTKENYIVVANDQWTIVTYYELTEDPKPATWVSGTSGLTGYQYGGVANLASDGCIVAVKLDKLDAYASGEIEDEEMIFIEQDDVDGKLVGTEIEIEFNADKTVKGFKATGKSVVGELTITKEGDKFTAKIGDKVFLDKADASAKLATKAFDSILASGYYVSSATKKAVFAANSAENIDLQVVFGNESRDVTTVGIFYDEFYNFNYEGGVDGYDWDGDGKLDLVVVNRPHTVKATADSDGTSAAFGVLGDNHSYCGCGGWHTQTTVSTGTIAAGIVKNDILFVYEDYKIGAYNVTKPEVITAKLESVDIAAGKATIGGKTYNLYNAGDLPYLNGKAVTQYETEAQSALWNNSVGVNVSVIVDKCDNIVWATQATEAQVVDAAWELAKGTTLGTHTLTGKITSVDTPYSEQYKNITVTIVVGDKADKPIVCYRIKGEGVEGLAVGDTITLTGELLNYADSSEKGKVEFNANTVVTKIVKGEKPAEPDTPVTPPAPHTHAWDAGKVTTAATCKAEGVKTFTCACGETKTEKIAKLTTHTYKDGVCSVCGAKDPNYVAPKAENAYIVVANDEWTIVTYFELVEDPKPAAWPSADALKGLSGYQSGGVSYLAPDGMMCAVKIENLEAYASGDIDDEDIIYIEEDDSEGKYVGTEVLIDLNADGTVKSFKQSGASVVGKLTITKEGDKYTVKIGDKVMLDKVAANTKFTAKAYDSTAMSGYYVCEATMKAVVNFGSVENFDLQLCYGNDKRDVTTVGLFYDEFYNINYEGYVDGYDWDGDGKIDLAIVSRPQTGKATADSDGKAVMIGIVGDNHGNCGCGGWHTNTQIGTDMTITNGTVVTVYEDYKTGTYTIVIPETITGKLNKVDIAQGKVWLGDKTYNLDNSGELPYVNTKQVSQYNKETYKAQWEAAVTKEISIKVDKLGNIIWASLPA